MSVSRYRDAPGHNSVEFHCDADNCEEELQTGYSMYSYATGAAHAHGWYIMPDLKGGWLHLCPSHGKAEWLKRKRAEEEA